MKVQLGTQTDFEGKWVIIRFQENKGDVVGDIDVFNDWLSDAMGCSEYGFYKIKNGTQEKYKFTQREKSL